MAGAQNLGTVKAIHVGTTAPTNTAMIWYDTNTGIFKHKVYDAGTSSWILLQPGSIPDYALAEHAVGLNWTDAKTVYRRVIPLTAISISFLIEQLAPSVGYVDNMLSIDCIVSGGGAGARDFLDLKTTQASLAATRGGGLVESGGSTNCVWNVNGLNLPATYTAGFFIVTYTKV